MKSKKQLNKGKQLKIVESRQSNPITNKNVNISISISTSPTNKVEKPMNNNQKIIKSKQDELQRVKKQGISSNNIQNKKQRQDGNKEQQGKQLNTCAIKSIKNIVKGNNKQNQVPQIPSIHDIANLTKYQKQGTMSRHQKTQKEIKQLQVKPKKEGTIKSIKKLDVMNIQKVKQEVSQSRKIVQNISNITVQNTKNLKLNHSRTQTASNLVSNKLIHNQQIIHTQSRLLTNTLTNQQLISQIPIKQKENKRMQTYFKHLGELISSIPKNQTFQNVKSIYRTISMTQWMIFCKKFGILNKCKQFNSGYGGFGNGVKFLSYFFRKYQDNDKRMSFTCFLSALREVMIKIIDYQVENYIKKNKQNQNQIKSQQKIRIQKTKQIYQLLCVSSKKKHIEKLREIGIMCSQQVYIIPRSGLKTQRHSKQSPVLPKNQRNSTCIGRVQPQSANKQNQTLKIPKIYKSSLERKQSVLMHSLAVSNINKITPSEETKNILDKFIGKEDRYLKEYFNKQEKIRHGVIARLDNKYANGRNQNKIRI